MYQQYITVEELDRTFKGIFVFKTDMNRPLICSVQE